MSMFENFPYTNLHEINLQWLIEEVKKCYSPDNPPETMVISVNGESGTVTLYRDAHIAFPDVNAIQWNMYRGSGGKITGIEFNKDAPATRINGIQRFVIYDAGNPPPYPVVSVNGQTGEIILYSEAYVEFPDLDGNNWGIQRKLNADTENETMIGLMLDDEGNFSITKDEDTIPVYTEDNPPPYPVRSVDDLTGNVYTWGYNTASKINIPLPAPGDDWSIGRVIEQGGNLSLKIMYDDNIQKCTAYMIYDDGVNTPTPIKLLTLDDIPTSAGVVSFNGQTGVITITGADLHKSTSDNRTIDTAITDNTNAINTLKGLIAYYEPSNVATHNISINSWVIWNNNIYKANQAISINDALGSNNLTQITKGALNDIEDKLDRIEGLKAGSNYVGNIFCAGYNTGSGNYVDAFVPLNTNGRTIQSATASASSMALIPTGRIDFNTPPTINILESTNFGFRVEVTYPSTQAPSVPATLYLTGLTVVCS